MTNINDPIPYQWSLGWEGMSGQPSVTLLLKAVIEKDISEMNRLADMGASLKASDENTLERILFHVMDCYPVMSWMVKHGLSRIGNDIDGSGDNGINSDRCISQFGYSWGLTARAYYLKAFDVMELLAVNGFNDFHCNDKGWSSSWEADVHIFKNGDEKGLKILLENGYVFPNYKSRLQEYYETYVLNRIQVRRKTVGLDEGKFSKSVPLPQYEKEPLIFGRKEAKARNRRRYEDYEDRVRAIKEFQLAYGHDNVEAYRKAQAERQQMFSDAMKAVLHRK